MSSAERDDRDESWVDEKIKCLGEMREDDPFRVTLNEQDKPREVKLGIGQDGTTYELAGFNIISRQLNSLHSRYARLCATATVTDLAWLDAAKDCWRMARNYGLRPAGLSQRSNLADDSSKEVG